MYGTDMHYGGPEQLTIVQRVAVLMENDENMTIYTLHLELRCILFSRCYTAKSIKQEPLRSCPC